MVVPPTDVTHWLLVGKLVVGTAESCVILGGANISDFVRLWRTGLVHPGCVFDALADRPASAWG